MASRYKLKRILVALDDSSCSKRGLDFATYIAKLSGGRITGIHVIPFYPRNLVELVTPYKTHLMKRGKKIISQAKKKSESEGIKFTGKILEGDPKYEISHLAIPKKFDAVVIGSRGLGGLKGFLLGSVSNGVLNSSKIPVFVTR